MTFVENHQLRLFNTPNNLYQQSTESTLVSYFDDETYKNSTEMCSYHDFLPYNSLLTQAIMNCTEAAAATTPNDEAAANQQNAIDNLKALSNFQSSCSTYSHTTTITDTSNNSSELIASSCKSTSETLIYSAQPSCSNGTGGGAGVHHHHHRRNDDDDDEECDDEEPLQLESDECLEAEEVAEAQQEDMTWDAFDPYLFIKHLPPLTCNMRFKCPALPLKTRSSPEFSLVLDLDETLVHCSLQELSDASFKFPVLFQVR